MWDGTIGWSGGHLWQVTISDLALQPMAVPEPGAAALLVSAFAVARLVAFTRGARTRSRPA